MVRSLASSGAETNIARDGDAEGCEHLATWGRKMVAIRENYTNGSHFATSDPEAPTPPKPVSNPKINSCPVGLPYPDENPSAVSPFSVKLPLHTQVRGSLPRQNGGGQQYGGSPPKQPKMAAIHCNPAISYQADTSLTSCYL